MNPNITGNTPLSRREFLRWSGQAAAAMMLPSFPEFNSLSPAEQVVPTAPGLQRLQRFFGIQNNPEVLTASTNKATIKGRSYPIHEVPVVDGAFKFTADPGVINHAQFTIAPNEKVDFWYAHHDPKALIVNNPGKQIATTFRQGDQMVTNGDAKRILVAQTVEEYSTTAIGIPQPAFTEDQTAWYPFSTATFLDSDRPIINAGPASFATIINHLQEQQGSSISFLQTCLEPINSVTVVILGFDSATPLTEETIITIQKEMESTHGELNYRLNEAAINTPSFKGVYPASLNYPQHLFIAPLKEITDTKL